MFKKVMHLVSLIFILVTLQSCSGDYFFPTTPFDNSQTFRATDYSNIDNWAAHPDKEDTADRIPEQENLSDQSDMPVDVFFIHPTTLTGYEGETYWNADSSNKEINERTDNTTILFQASIFNAAGKVYAPRYQQAHVQAYYSSDPTSGQKALDWAYEDVKVAFEYFLKNNNNGRPFILASHSQGTTHAKKLLKEYIDGKPLQNQLVAAYLIGIIVKKDEFTSITPCENPGDIGCTISWRTFREDVDMSTIITSDAILATNPLSWKTDDIYMPASANKGTILRDIDNIYDELVDAKVEKGILKVTKPSFFGSVFYTTQNYHIPDLNFFYFNTRENAKYRATQFLEKN